MGFNYASTTLMQKIMILKSVSMPTQKSFKSHGDVPTQGWLEDTHLDDKHEAMTKIILHIKQVI